MITLEHIAEQQERILFELKHLHDEMRLMKITMPTGRNYPVVKLDHPPGERMENFMRSAVAVLIALAIAAGILLAT